MDHEEPGEVLGDDWGESPLERSRRALSRRRPENSPAPEPRRPAQPWRPQRLLVVAVAAVLLLAGFVVALRVAGGPRLAAVQVAAADAPIPSSPWWQPGPDGRPAGPVLFSAAATLRRGSTGVPTGVVGIAGPGVVRIWNAVTMLPKGEATIVPFRSLIDCTALPAVIPTGKYRLRLEGQAGAIVSEVPAGAAGELWRTQIQLACATWWARRDLTLTALAAQVQPTSSRLDVSMTVTNSGSRPETVFPGRPRGTAVAGPGPASGPAPVPVPPHSTRSISLPVTFQTCDAVPLAPDDSGRLAVDPMLSSPLGVTGLAGPIGEAVIGDAVLGPDEEQEGFSSTSLVLAPKAARSLGAALSQACGDVGPMITLVAPGSVEFDSKQRVLTVSLLLDVEPGRVRSMRLDSQDGPGGAAFRPLWTTISGLTPDRTGQARVTLHYRAPTPGPDGQECPSQGGYLPSFIATLTVPVAGTERIVRYSGTPDLNADLRAIAVLC